MSHREKEALDRFLTTDPANKRSRAECANCEGQGSFLVTLTDEPSDPETGGARKSVECPVCGGTGDAPAVAELEVESPDPCPVCDWIGCHEPECRLFYAEACEECGTALDPDDRGEEGLGGWQYVEEYSDAPFHAPCLAERRAADEREAREIEAAWQADPVAQAEEQAARVAGGDVVPPDLDLGGEEARRIR